MHLKQTILWLIVSALTVCISRTASANLNHIVTMKSAAQALLEIQTFIKNNPQKVDEFWSKVDKEGPQSKPHLTKCWIWRGSLIDVYGCIGSVPTLRSPIRSHRFSFVLHGGLLTDRKPHVLHSCDVTLCVNPQHLRAGDQIDNNRDKILAGRQSRGESHRSVLTEQQVRQIRARYASGGVLYKDLAQEYGVCCATIGEIVRRIIWTHIP
jgi:hypothetical protein